MQKYNIIMIYIETSNHSSWILGKNDESGALYKIGFVTRPEKLSDGSGKMNIWERQIEVSLYLLSVGHNSDNRV
jgi:hypothetical protein